MICSAHGISERICGCGAPAESPPKPDAHRDFASLEPGTRVRFAKTYHEIETCPVCGLPGVRLEPMKARETLFAGLDPKHPDIKKAKRIRWVHDADVGPSGFVAGAVCTKYEVVDTKQRKKRRVDAVS